MSHAIHCEHCGQLLEYASGDFSDLLTPEEEAHIASLESSTEVWQVRLATALQAAHPSAPAAPVFGYRWLGAVAALATPPRAALAAAVFAAVVLGVQDYHLQNHLAEQSSRTAAEFERLQADAGQQREQIAQRTSQPSAPIGASASAPRPARTPLPAALVSAAQDHIATLLLESGLTRGTGQMKRLTIPAAAETVKVILHAPASADLAGGQVREELMTVDRQPIWSQQMRPSPAEVRSGRLSLLVPARLLTPDDYLIVLSRPSQTAPEENEPEQIATYSFRVPR